MSTLTKEQVKNLTPEQQEAYGVIEARLSRKHQELLEQARGSRILTLIVAMVLVIIPFVGLFFMFESGERAPIFFVFIGAIILILYLFGRLTDRQDALLELLEEHLRGTPTAGQPGASNSSKSSQ
jgi:hypothetical protein